MKFNMFHLINIRNVHKKELGNFREIPENSRLFPLYQIESKDRERNGYKLPMLTMETHYATIKKTRKNLQHCNNCNFELWIMIGRIASTRNGRKVQKSRVSKGSVIRQCFARWWLGDRWIMNFDFWLGGWYPHKMNKVRMLFIPA